VLYKNPIMLNLYINNSNMSLIGIDSLGLNKAIKVPKITRGLL
jgi:hypothetical protein